MPRENTEVDNYGKTATLIAAGNLILAPLYWVDKRLGLSVAIGATAAFLFAAHEVGKKNRPVANAASSIAGIFVQSKEIENAMKNVVAGGAVLFDEIFPENKPKSR